LQIPNQKGSRLENNLRMMAGYLPLNCRLESEIVVGLPTNPYTLGIKRLNLPLLAALDMLQVNDHWVIPLFRDGSPMETIN
jgi:hypothetical protein